MIPPVEGAAPGDANGYGSMGDNAPFHSVDPNNRDHPPYPGQQNSGPQDFFQRLFGGQ